MKYPLLLTVFIVLISGCIDSPVVSTTTTLPPVASTQTTLSTELTTTTLSPTASQPLNVAVSSKMSYECRLNYMSGPLYVLMDGGKYYLEKETASGKLHELIVGGSVHVWKSGSPSGYTLDVMKTQDPAVAASIPDFVQPYAVLSNAQGECVPIQSSADKFNLPSGVEFKKTG